MSKTICHHRTLFLSDLHLGALGGRSDLILTFLKQNPADTYYLVGDILDLWQPLLPHWNADDQRVLDYLRQCQSRGATLHYLRGNHDPQPQTAPAEKRLDLPVHDQLIHHSPNGQRYLVLHGDVIDSRLFRHHAMTRLGSRIDHLLRLADRFLLRLRRNSTEARTMIEAMLFWINAMSYRGRQHEEKLVKRAKDGGYDGVICGHFHIAELHRDHGVWYANCGDWVDSMSAIAEAHDGSLQLLTLTAAPVAQTDPIGKMTMELT